jgi:hypothetical protein
VKLPFVLLLDTRSVPLLLLSVPVLGAGLGLTYGPQVALTPNDRCGLGDHTALRPGLQSVASRNRLRELQVGQGPVSGRAHRRRVA